ncbi:MAG TPA: hypothetical protein VK871_12675 [Candidatus Limnocylindrales bacterium]|nr:hypothetical protein [Candidatus Limnocylindrales bacterium]
MALHPTSQVQQAARHDLTYALALGIAIIALIVIASMVFTLNLTVPSLEFVPDPAGLELPF